MTLGISTQCDSSWLHCYWVHEWLLGAFQWCAIKKWTKCYRTMTCWQWHNLSLIPLTCKSYMSNPLSPISTIVFAQTLRPSGKVSQTGNSDVRNSRFLKNCDLCTVAELWCWMFKIWLKGWCPLPFCPPSHPSSEMPLYTTYGCVSRRTTDFGGN